VGEGERRPAADLVAEGRRRYEAGDYADAEPLATAALGLRPDGTDAPARSEALQLVGEIQYSLGRYPEARALADEAALLRAGAPDDARAETLNLQGVIDVAFDDPQRGLARLEEALRLRETALGPDHPDAIEALNNTGVALFRVDRAAEAIARHEEALRRCERAFDEPTRSLAVTLNALAVKLARAEETRDRARDLYARSLAAAEAALGPEHPMVATLVANHATQAINADDFEAARPYAERSLDLHERRFGPSHPSTANALAASAQVAAHDARFAEAIGMAGRAASIRLDAFGMGDRRAQASIVALVNLYGRLLRDGPADDDDRAEAMALFGVYRNLDPEKAKAGPFAYSAADLGAAERDLRAYFERAAARVAAVDPAARLELDRARSGLVSADANFAAGEIDAAALAIESAIERIERVRGTDGLDLAEPLRRLAALERARQRRDRAIELEGRALAILAASYGERHPYVLRARLRLAMESELEYGRAAGRAQLERVRDALGPAEPGGIAARLHAEIDQHLGHIPADSEVDPIGRSARRRAALERPSPLAAALAPELERVASSPPPHTHGAVIDTQAELRLLLADDLIVVREAFARLSSSIGGRPALDAEAAAQLAYLLKVAADPRVPHRSGAIALVALLCTSAIAERGATSGAPPASSGAAAVLAELPRVRALLRDLRGAGDDAVRQIAVLALAELDAVESPPGRVH
jgi:tetratricopeptide (TPR) repeat protein